MGVEQKVQWKFKQSSAAPADAGAPADAAAEAPELDYLYSIVKIKGGNELRFFMSVS